MRRSVLLSAPVLIFVAFAAFAPSAFAASYSGSGQTTQGGWFVTYYFYSSATVDTGQHVLSLFAYYPGGYNTWTSGLTFLAGLISVQDKYGTMWFGWYSGQDHCSGYCWWSFSTSYSTANTGEIVNVFLYYGGAGIFGGVGGNQVQIQYSFNVGG
jgi:hypothetical protein